MSFECRRLRLVRGPMGMADGPSADGPMADGPSADGRRPSAPPPSFSFGTRRFQKNAFFHFQKCYFNAFFVFLGLFFRPRDPSKKLRHVVRINLVQFSAPELQ